MKEYSVFVRPQEKQISIKEDMRLMTALVQAGFKIKSTCGGKASCTDCIVKVVHGEDHLVPPEFKELSLLGNVFHLTKERLSCQTFVRGDISVDISGHKQSSEKVKTEVTQSKKKTLIKKKQQDGAPEVSQVDPWRDGGFRKPRKK
jgi:ferredoxin